MNEEAHQPIYHVLLIGIDAYPPKYDADLAGCINDIDAIEDLLSGDLGVGLPTTQVRISRIANPPESRNSSSRLQDATVLPTKDNVVEALKRLADPEVVSNHDRVLVYYSGHGVQKRWEGSTKWHEALVLHDGRDLQYLFDVEANGLLNSIADRTPDLTVVLDCCHSAGATRDFHRDSGIGGARRTLRTDDTTAAPVPDLAALGLEERRIDADLGVARSNDAKYLLVAGAQANESAKEGYLDGRLHGAFTNSLLKIVRAQDPKQRAKARWSDIWSRLVADVAESAARIKLGPQHPRSIGRRERAIWGGGPLEPMDPGVSVSTRDGGEYLVESGTLLGVTDGAEFAVYGAQPTLFPPIGSAGDTPIGRLRITHAGRATSVALPIGEAFPIPPGVRARLVRAGMGERLRVSLKPRSRQLRKALSGSELIEILPEDAVESEIEVIERTDGSLTLGDDTEPVIALVPPGEHQALRPALESYYRYATALRMALNSRDPELSGALNVELLDCSGEGLVGLDAAALGDPQHLPGVPRDTQGNYRLPEGMKFCVRVTNASSREIHAILLNCSAGGLVEHLGETTLRSKATDVLWLRHVLGTPFVATVDALPEMTPARSVVTERLIVVATTKAGTDLTHMVVDKHLQTVVDENLRSPTTLRGGEKAVGGGGETRSTSSELWTAVMTPLQIEVRGRP